MSARWYDPITKQTVEEYDNEIARESSTWHTATTRADGTFRFRVSAPARTHAWSIRAIVRDAAGRETGADAYVEAPATARDVRYYNVSLRDGSEAFAIGDAVTAQVTGDTGREAGWHPPAAPTATSSS